MGYSCEWERQAGEKRGAGHTGCRVQCVWLCVYFDNNIVVRPMDAVTVTRMRPFSKICVRDAGRAPIYISVNHMNPIWVSGVPQGSILGLFCFLLLSGKLPLKTADRQAHNATQRVAL